MIGELVRCHYAWDTWFRDVHELLKIPETDRISSHRVMP